MLMAHRIGEHPDVMLPVMVCQDGFITSHAIENIELVEDEKVKAFVGEYKPTHYLLDRENPISVVLWICRCIISSTRDSSTGNGKRQKVILEVAEEFYKLTEENTDF